MSQFVLCTALCCLISHVTGSQGETFDVKKHPQVWVTVFGGGGGVWCVCVCVVCVWCVVCVCTCLFAHVCVVCVWCVCVVCVCTCVFARVCLYGVCIHMCMCMCVSVCICTKITELEFSTAQGTEVKAITYSNMQVFDEVEKHECYVIIDI